MAELLYTSKYVKPGAYIGEVITPSSSVATALRIPAAIGKGSKYALSKNASVVRAYVYDEDITFSTTSPYRALLKHTALMDVEKATLVRVSDNYEIPESKWYFEDSTHIIIEESEYVAGDFQLSYQSTDSSVLDPSPVNDIMNFRHVGDTADADKYKEGTDYFLMTELSNILKSNGDPTSALHFDDRYESDSLYATIDGVTSTSTKNGTILVDVSDVVSVEFNSSVVATPKQVKLISSSASGTYTLAAAALAQAKDLTFENIGISYSKEKVIAIVVNGGTGYTQATSKANVDGTSTEGHGFWYYDSSTGTLTVWQTTEIKSLVFTYTYRTLHSVIFSYTYVLDAYGSVGEGTVEVLNDGSFMDTPYGVSVCLSSTNDNALDYDSYAAAIVTLDGALDSSGTSSTFSFKVIQGKIFPTAKDNRSVTLKLSAKNDVTYTHSLGSLSGTFADSISLTAPAVNSNPIIGYVDTYSVKSLGLITGTTDYLPIQITHSYPEGTSVSFVSYVPVTVTGENITLVSDTGITLSNGIVVTLAKTKNSSDVVYTQNATFAMFKHTCTASATTGAVQWYYTSNTSEGGFGTVTCDLISGSLALPGNIIIYYDARSLSVGDSFTFTLTNDNLISWNLTKKVTEAFKTSLVHRDVNGAVTGVYGSYYVALSGVPLNGISVTNLGTLTARVVTDSSGNATSFVSFTNAGGIPAKPSSTIQISYEYEGVQPAVGNTYYVTTTHIRPDSLYNSIQIISSRKEGELLFAPATPTNDLYMANEIAWDEIGDSSTEAQVAFIQIKDSDDDGVITTTDVHTAIDAVATSKTVTDITLLGQFDSIGYLCRMNQDANDPFAARENELWVGAPVGTIVGDVNTEGSLVYIAKSTLKVYGEDPAHGTRCLVGSTWAKKSVTMDSGNSQTVTMDGSFIGWAISCMRSVMDTSESILRKQLYSFSDMEILDDVSTDLLGAANIIYFSKSSDSVYQIEEDFTVDTYSFEFSLEQITSQRLVTTRRVRKFLNENAIGYVPDTPQAGVAFISGLLVRALTALVNDGTIGPYQDEDGYARKIDPDKDIFITYVKDDPTKYQFGYGFYTKKVIKQLFGIYVVDKDFSSLGIGQ